MRRRRRRRMFCFQLHFFGWFERAVWVIVGVTFDSSSVGHIQNTMTYHLLKSEMTFAVDHLQKS
jgi:hypothetical protein